jgi:hypothetical protein
MTLLSALQVTPNDYLETALMPVGGVGAAVEAKNAIRTSIKSLFPDRDCATLVRPMHDELVSWQSNDLLRLFAASGAARQGTATLLQL